MKYNGLGMDIGNLYRLSDAKTRSICAENITGEVGGGARTELADGVSGFQAEKLGKGWKVNPYLKLPAGETLTITDIKGSGAIQHIWCTPTGRWQNLIIRFYWDGEENPAIECPLGSFFGCGLEEYAPLTSLAICVNPGRAFNCYWEMPFKTACRITIENREDEVMTFFYQVDYTLTEIPDDAGYFCAYYNRSNPLPYKEEHLLLDIKNVKGHYVGTYMTWGVNNNGWWGEGEIKFFMDDDTDYPTICGTGTEDYFCGSYNFENSETKRYEEFCTPYAGLNQVIRPDGLYKSQTRFGLYRWHIKDPIRFENRLKVNIQALGWGPDGKYLPLRDDITSVAFWYQDSPNGNLPQLPGYEGTQVI